jgi:hypothetical protein
MEEIEIFNKLKVTFPKLIADKYPFPAPYEGKGKVKAIILGADPTHIVEGHPKTLDSVFGLDIDNSPYWRMMKKNIELLQSISMDEVYVQNICRNYFTQETTQNKEWLKIARDYWSGLLKKELDAKFNEEVPILATTEFILHAIKTAKGKLNANEIYTNCITIPSADNLLSREIIAFYRHPKYSLNNWSNYKDFVKGKLK